MTQHEDTDSLQIVPDPDKLDRYHRQQLSAMLDGELSPDQARFMLRRLQHDTDLADSWERWQVCGDALRGQRNALLPADFASKVSAAIVADGQHEVEIHSGTAGPRLLRWGGGAALAASVAMAALLVGRQAGIEPDQVPPPAFPEIAVSGEFVPDVRTPAPSEPAAEPESAPVADAATLLAGTALAAAQAPRRVAAGRRAREQGQASAVAQRASSGSLGVPQLVAVPMVDPAPPRGGSAIGPRTADPAPRSGPHAGASLIASRASTPHGIGADPFEALPMTTNSRPWPRAAEGSGGGYAVGFGSATPAAPAWPRLFEPGQETAAGLFGLPADAAPWLSPATAIGTTPIPVPEPPPAAAVAPGPR